MQRLQDDYLAAYRSLKLTRDSEGVLVAEFHSNNGPFTFTAQDHTEFVDAFYRIAQDRANKIVILTGAGGEFIPYIDFSSFGNVAEGGPIDISNELPAGARKDYNLVRSILRNSVEGIDKFRVRLGGHNAWPAVGVKFGNQDTFGVPSQF